MVQQRYSWQGEKRGKLIRKLRKTRSPYDKENMIAQRDQVKNLIFAEKTAFYQRALSKAGTDSKTLFRIFQDLMANYKMNPLPDVSAITNANDFNAFFVDKIRRLKERFNDDLDHKPTTVIL